MKFQNIIILSHSSCLMELSLYSQDYPKHRHPGWNKGSIAYHAGRFCFYIYKIKALHSSFQKS